MISTLSTALDGIVFRSTTMLALSSISKSSRFVGVMYAGLFFFTTALFNALRGITGRSSFAWLSPSAALEQLGLEPKRDNISFLPIGDAVTIGHSLEAGRIDAAVLDPPLSRRLTGKGFTELVDLAKTNASFPGLGVGVTRSNLDQQPATLEKVVTALTEGLAFIQLPANKPVAVKILMKHLRVSDPAVAEDGYQDHLSTLNRKPYPSLDGLRSAQRLMAQQNPKVAALKLENLVDSRFVRKLDDSGFIDRLYTGQP